MAVTKAAFVATVLGAPSAAYEPAFSGVAVMPPVYQAEMASRPDDSRITAQAGLLLQPMRWIGTF